MKLEDVEKYANIKNDGSILLGQYTVCDGASYGRKIGVFTHIHRDHTALFNQAMHECSQIYVSYPTLDLLAAMEQDFTQNVSAEAYFKGRHIHPLDMRTPIIPKLDEFSGDPQYGDKITFIPSKHILGSCQVLVETKDNVRILYSSDFAKGTVPESCNILVLDSTHGDPMFNTGIDNESLERRLVQYVDEEIQNTKSILVRAHRGRLEYTMHLLSEHLPKDMPFLVHPIDLKLIPVYRKYGMPIRECISYTSFEGEKKENSGYPYVEFRVHGQGTNFLEGTEKMTVFELGGKFLGGGSVLRHTKDNKYDLEFMDHADYSSIVEYVKQASPEYVVVDYARGKQGLKLANSLEKEGFKCIALPMSG